MNFMFIVPAAVASCIIACRSFVSLTDFRRRNVCVQPAHRPSVDPSGGNAIQVHACGSGGCIGDSSHLKKVTSTEYSIAGSAYRSVVAGINSMGQTYGLDEFDTTRTTNTFATVQDMIRDYDFGNQNGHVLVHTETVEYRDAEDSMDMETGFGVAK